MCLPYGRCGNIWRLFFYTEASKACLRNTVKEAIHILLTCTNPVHAIISATSFPSKVLSASPIPLSRIAQ